MLYILRIVHLKNSTVVRDFRSTLNSMLSLSNRVSEWRGGHHSNKKVHDKSFAMQKANGKCFEVDIKFVTCV